MAFIKVNAFFAIFLLAVTTVCSQQAQAVVDVNNGSFEGDPNMLWGPNGAWNSNGKTPEICQTFRAHDKTGVLVEIEAIDGNSFVMLSTGGNSLETSYSQLTQPIHIDAGESITGAYFFATTDWMPSWNDTATIYLSKPNATTGLFEPNSITGLFDISILLAQKDVNSVVIYGGPATGCMDGWERFGHTFDSNGAGDYMLVLRIEDAIDYAYSSFLAVDALRIMTEPPPPICTYNLVGDLNRDCKVNFVDFAMMAENWLIDCNMLPRDLACK